MQIIKIEDKDYDFRTWLGEIKSTKQQCYGDLKDYSYEKDVSIFIWLAL